MSGREATVTTGPCGILHITFGQDNQPHLSPAQQVQRAISRLVADLDLIAQAYGGTREQQHPCQAG